MPKVSIIIPVHDAEQHLHACLNSVIGQTLEDTEVICIDDCSTDASADILSEYAKRDSRVQVITFSENATASKARKEGVLASTGDYVLFVDADDTIEPHACALLYAEMLREPVDILHFGTSVTGESDVPPEVIGWVREFIGPYHGTLEGDRILDGAFSANRLYNFTLWDKFYTSEVCKRAFARIQDDPFPRAQDKYAYFLLSYFARTYRGLPDEALYHYHFGEGITGKRSISMATFEKACSMALVADAIRDFLIEEGALERFRDQCRNAREELLQDCFAAWRDNLGEHDRVAGFSLMLAYWETPEVTAGLAGLSQTERSSLAASLLLHYSVTHGFASPAQLYTPRSTRTGAHHHLLSLSRFEKSCSTAALLDEIREALAQAGLFDQHEAAYTGVRNELLLDCATNWSGQLHAEDRASGFDLMLKYWEASETVVKIAKLNWADRGHVARLLAGSNALSRTPRDVRVVGTYYHEYSNGGVERILSTSIKLWRQLGYEVVLLTDLPPTPDDYELPEGVHRVVIPSFFDVEADTYVARARAIEAAIDHYKIDVMVYHAWLAPILLWDLLLYKTKGVAVVTHCHSVFSQPVRTIWTYFAEMPSIYRLADAVVTLGEVDSAYWRNFNDNVIQVANPLTNDLDDVKVSSLESKNVLWLGRMSDEKRPHEALRIFAEVLKEEPEAKLFMVGDSADDAYMDGLFGHACDLGIRSSLVMCGFHTDVRPFYEMASVFLMTSEYEGFSMTLSESQSAGVPCVMYDLPYLTLTRPGRGFVSVEFGDIDAAADAVVDLLADPEYRHRLGREARANIEELARFDFAGTWRRLFEDLARPTPGLPRDENTRIMWETLLGHYRTGAVCRNREAVQLKKQISKVKQTAKRDAKKAAQKERQLKTRLRKVRKSRAYRVGRVLTALPRKIRKLLKRLR